MAFFERNQVQHLRYPHQTGQPLRGVFWRLILVLATVAAEADSVGSLLVMGHSLLRIPFLFSQADS